MSEKSDLDIVLNYVKQYVENEYEHDNVPLLNWEDLQLMLDEINLLRKENKILKDYIQELKEVIKNV